MDNRFEDILDDCLERLLVKNETLEDCLNAYPEQVDMLKPLLETTLITKQVSSSIEPRPDFKASARHDFRIALKDASSKKNYIFPRFRFQWATALVTILVMLIASGGLLFASSTSMPDNPLYSVKRAVEQMQLNLTFSDLGKANLYAKFADRRASEILQMAQKGDSNFVMASSDLLGDQLLMIASLTKDTDSTWQNDGSFNKDGQLALEADEQPVRTTGSGQQPEEPGVAEPPILSTDIISEDSLVEDSGTSELLNRLVQDGNQNSEALRDILITAPESVQPALLEAITVLETSYNNAIIAISE